MPKGYKFEEDKTEVAEKETPETKKDKNEVIFFASHRSMKVQYKPEEKFNDGTIKSPTTVLQFVDNLLMTSDPDEIECIKTSNSFKMGTIKQCKDMDEFRGLKSARILQRQGKLSSPLIDDDTTVEEMSDPNRPITEAPVVSLAGAE